MRFFVFSQTSFPPCFERDVCVRRARFPIPTFFLADFFLPPPVGNPFAFAIQPFRCGFPLPVAQHPGLSSGGFLFFFLEAGIIFLLPFSPLPLRERIFFVFFRRPFSRDSFFFFRQGPFPTRLSLPQCPTLLFRSPSCLAWAVHSSQLEGLSLLVRFWASAPVCDRGFFSGFFSRCLFKQRQPLFFFLNSTGNFCQKHSSAGRTPSFPTSSRIFPLAIEEMFFVLFPFPGDGLAPP